MTFDLRALTLELCTLTFAERPRKSREELKDQSSKFQARSYSSYLLNNNAAFVPPNPKLLDSAYRGWASRALLGM